MIGLVVIGYGVLPEAILTALQCATGQQDKICAVSIGTNKSADEQRQAILTAVNQVDSEGHGALVFTDSMSSTAGHLTLSIIDKVNIEVIGGVNLPMLTKVVEKRSDVALEELAQIARDEGRKAITWRRP